MGEKVESERERFLKTGELTPAKEKPKSETEADSSKQQTEHEASAAESQKPGADNRGTQAESDDVPHFLDKKWTQAAHDERKRSAVSVIHELAKQPGPDGKTVLEKIPMPSPAGDPKANQKIDFFLGLLADTRNPTGVLNYFADHPNISKNWQWGNQSGMERIIRDFELIDRQVGRGGSGNGKGTSQASPKPRAPKTPREVGGRFSSSDDGTKGETNFSSFDRMQRALYYR